MRELSSEKTTAINSISVIGNYLPRKCGIATFTTDLVESLSSEACNSNCWAVAMNDKQDGYSYPDKVRYEITQDSISDYRMAAEFLNINKPDVVCLQHEYGIFGGPAGSHVLELLSKINIPVVTTLHTVLTKPSNEHTQVMTNLAEVSDRMVVMSRRAADILNAVYDIPRKKINYIPHGIPDIPFIDPNYSKDQFDVLGKNVLMTFGLLSRNKGIEYVLKALPSVVEKFPDLVYMVLGATHPHVLKEEGENYRESLQNLVEELGLTGHVEFHNRFVTKEELCQFLEAADLYITPYVEEAQITSGTLAYALGTGKAVISTPYWYAKEMLSDNKGILVPFRDSDAMADGIINFLENDAERHQARISAYDASRNAIWSEVANQYLDVFGEVIRERNRRPNHLFSLSAEAKSGTTGKVKNIYELPGVNLNHLKHLTDDTGVLQHAKYTIADRSHGYCTDDNARALIVALLAERLSDSDSEQTQAFCENYLSFLLDAFDSETGRFRNFMNFSRQWLETVGSEDSHGRAIWALGLAISLSESKALQQLASTVFTKSLNAVETFQSPRSIAFSLIGMDACLEKFPGDSEARRKFEILAMRLFRKFTDNAADDWPWPEEKLTYANAKLPHALLVAGQRLQRSDILQMGLESLEWLLKVQTEKGHFVPVGNSGWFTRGSEKSRFDQQPIEANAMVEACVAAFHTSGDDKWVKGALMCLNWFLGVNDLHLPLYDPETGGCRDGLESDGVNQNQGAESTLAWLLSLTVLHHFSAEHNRKDPGREKAAKIIN
ncbi:MAG: glycosyltransferase family 4 protein [Balneolaceae bacterium]